VVAGHLRPNRHSLAFQDYSYIF